MREEYIKWYSKNLNLEMSMLVFGESGLLDIDSEARLAAEVAHRFRQFGGEVYTEDVLSGRPNVYGLWRRQTDRWLAVDVHMDTVSVEQMTGDPFSGHVADQRVYGRGAVDTKASLAIILALLEELHQTGQKPATNLLISATVDEDRCCESGVISPALGPPFPPPAPLALPAPNNPDVSEKSSATRRLT